MRHRYDCPQCELTSDPFLRRSVAEDVGEAHRDKRHDGMHPKGESILVESFALPSDVEWRPVVITAALILVALVGKFL